MEYIGNCVQGISGNIKSTKTINRTTIKNNFKRIRGGGRNMAAWSRKEKILKDEGKSMRGKTLHTSEF